VTAALRTTTGVTFKSLNLPSIQNVFVVCILTDQFLTQTKDMPTVWRHASLLWNSSDMWG
jgi:hypothetical protein